MIVCGDQEACSANCGVEYLVVFGRINCLNNELDDVARCTKLTDVALGTGNGKEVFVRIADVVTFAVVELINFLEEHVQDIWRVERQECVLVNTTEELWDVFVFAHALECLAIQRELIVTTELHELVPVVFGIFANEERTSSPH